MKRITVNENQKAFLFKKGKYAGLLGAGRYFTSGGKKIEAVSVDMPICSQNCPLDVILSDKRIAMQVSVIDVPDAKLAIHFVNGRFSDILKCGKYAFWNENKKHEYHMTDISTPYVSEDVPAYIFQKLNPEMYTKIEVAEYQRARLYFDSRLVRVLEPGTYYFWKTNVSVSADYVDTRLQQMNITGQEIMTQDKVSLRINFVCSYKITDYVKVLTEIDDYSEQLHVAAQLALREYVGRYRLDDILANKDGLSEYVLSRIKAKEKELYIEITDAGVKDIILPGEIRDIMNTVLMAEKRAQANVITRREEVASTRSLLNTAKLMDENGTLYKLKEMEFVERICENVGSITLNGSGDILSQLTELLKGGKM